MREIVKFDYDSPPTRDDSIFYGDVPIEHVNHEIPEIDFDNDSYVLCFTGNRGAGKTSLMTYVAEWVCYKWGKRLISNYPISIDVVNQQKQVTNIRSEKLDLGKMFTFDGEYNNSLIVLDEAPQVINRLATMTWKNRLLDIYLQKIRHDQISFLYASQNEGLDYGWVDASLRFQTDLLIECKDAARLFPGTNDRGAVTLYRITDKSGMWSGHSYRERPRFYKFRAITKLIWGSFDTHQEFDVFESLRNVDMGLAKYKVTDKQDEIIPDGVIEKVMQLAEQGIKAGKMKMTDFYIGIGDIDQTMKSAIGKLLSKAGIRRYGGGWFDFSNFDMEKFHL